ncbi:RibD family protein [Acetobacteraceae bacterium H6797]|nr:RibD family protein [Acetobacteraceae bacterium H6797]
MDDSEAAAWAALSARRDGAGAALPAHPLTSLFARLFEPPTAPDGCIVIGRLAQTLDGRIAARNGQSQWIGGPGDMLHTHRLRALCHAVVVGAGTVKHDDPQLTTRLVEGPSPLRVVIDTERRLGTEYRVFAPGGPPTLLACAEDRPGGPTHGVAEVLSLPRCEMAGLRLPALLAALAARGITRIFVEGGGITVSRFLAQGLLDRLHLTVAPIILGSGKPAFALPEAQCIDDGIRAGWEVHRVGDDLLCDLALNRARPRICDGDAP